MTAKRKLTLFALLFAIIATGGCGSESGVKKLRVKKRKNYEPIKIYSKLFCTHIKLKKGSIRPPVRKGRNRLEQEEAGQRS
jgi:hypothetical protein